MSFMSRVKQRVQTAVNTVRAGPKPSAPTPKQPDAGALRDAFEASLPRAKVELSGGCTVTVGEVSAGQTVKGGSSLSTTAFGDTLGVSFKTNEGPATLGAVGVKAGGRELVMGLVPAAPSPLPLVVYAGAERKD